MVGDTTVTIDTQDESLKVQTFDGTTVTRYNEPSDTVSHKQTVSHEKTKTGITRSVSRLDENFINTAGAPEMASGYVVMTYSSVEGKARAREMAKANLAWLSANSNANLVDIAAKGYGLTPSGD
jgi:hypothetical protein